MEVEQLVVGDRGAVPGVANARQHQLLPAEARHCAIGDEADRPGVQAARAGLEKLVIKVRIPEPGAAGGMRDAESILDQLLSSTGGRVGDQAQ